MQGRSRSCEDRPWSSPCGPACGGPESLPAILSLRFIRATWLAVLLAGCASGQPQAGNTLEHLVVVWLKEPGNAAHRQTILSESEVLRDIPGVLSMKSGRVIPSDRAIVDDSFDVALVVSFADRAAMDAYLVHPTHVKLVNETLRPLVAKIRVFDFM